MREEAKVNLLKVTYVENEAQSEEAVWYSIWVLNHLFVSYASFIIINSFFLLSLQFVPTILILRIFFLRI